MARGVGARRRRGARHDGRALARPQGLQHDERLLHTAIAVCRVPRDRGRCGATRRRQAWYRRGDARGGPEPDRAAGRGMGVGGLAGILADRGRIGGRGGGLVQSLQPAILGLADQRRQRRTRAGSTRRSMRRSSATGSPAGSTGNSLSTSPSSACRTGRQGDCSRAAACCRAIRSTPSGYVPRCATTPCIADCIVAARASTEGWPGSGRLSVGLCNSARSGVDRCTVEPDSDRDNGASRWFVAPRVVLRRPRHLHRCPRHRSIHQHRRPTRLESATCCSPLSETLASTSSTTR